MSSFRKNMRDKLGFSDKSSEETNTSKVEPSMMEKKVQTQFERIRNIYLQYGLEGEVGISYSLATMSWSMSCEISAEEESETKTEIEEDKSMNNKIMKRLKGLKKRSLVYGGKPYAKKMSLDTAFSLDLYIASIEIAMEATVESLLESSLSTEESSEETAAS